MKIVLCTGGGDAPGLNAVIRSVVLAAVHRGWEVFGSRRGFGGFLGDARIVPLGVDEVSGITHLGGTIIGTSSRGDPYRWPQLQLDESWVEVDRSDEVVSSFNEWGFDALIVVGGDGTMRIASGLGAKGIPIVGVPKTIDNDVTGTYVTFGFDTAVNIATDAIDKLHSTAQSHERVFVVELMGRHAGWIALNAGLAGTADVILIPEIRFDMDRVCDKIQQREAMGKPFSIVVVAEGAVPKNGSLSVAEAAKEGGADRLGGIGEVVASHINKKTGKETRSLTLGHLQRGGPPTTFDRLLALRFGAAAVRAVQERKFGEMVALVPPDVVTIPISESVGIPKRVPLNGDTIQTARDMGVSLGD